MTEQLQELGLALQVLNVLVVPSLVWIGKYLVRLELRLSRMEWQMRRRELQARDTEETKP